MFIPSKANKDKAEKAAKKKALNQIRDWCMTLIPPELQQGLVLDISEVICGDPTCAPVDTAFTFVWEPVGKGMFGIPKAPEEITKDDILEDFPDVETLTAWQQGKKARWPPLPELRYQVGDRVECRIGPHPVKGWAPGKIIRLYYSEPNWPPNMIAPYQIALHDGRLIFAPQDTDNVIRLRPPAAPDAPSSPEYVPQEDEGDWEDMEEGNDDEEEEEGMYVESEEA